MVLSYGTRSQEAEGGEEGEEKKWWRRTCAYSGADYEVPEEKGARAHGP